MKNYLISLFYFINKMLNISISGLILFIIGFSCLVLSPICVLLGIDINFIRKDN